MTEEMAHIRDLPQAVSPLAAVPQDAGPTAKAGIMVGDVITAVNGTPVNDSRDLARKVAELAPNTPVKLDLLRNGQAKTLDVTPAKMPEQRQASAEPNGGKSDSSTAHLGLRIAPAGEVA